MTENCPVCGAKLLSYENPPRQLCPRRNKHHLYEGGQKVGSKGHSKGGPPPK